MWVLLLVITVYLIPTYAVEVKTTLIRSFDTLKECEDERIRIRNEFDKAYPPDERDYEFECKPVGKQHV